MSSCVAERRGRIGLIAAALTVALVLGTSSAAMAAPDTLKGGSVSIQLQKLKGLKLKPTSLGLPIVGGALDPIDGSGTVNVSGGFQVKRGKQKAKVKITSLTFGPGGGPGSIAVKIGKRKVGGFATTSGGSVARDGWGATLTGVSATLASKGAKALDTALSGKGTKGKKAAVAAKKGKAGQPLGSISVVTVPATVEVVPDSGNMTLATNAMGTFVSKLSPLSIDPIPTDSPPGLVAIPPGMTTDLLGTTFEFPVTGGAVAPDFSDGSLITAGGQTLTKNSSILNPSACGSAEPPVGTQLPSVGFQAQFAQNALATNTTLPTGFTLLANLAQIDFSTGSRSIDPVTKDLTVSGATVTLSAVAALTLNMIFPTESGNPSDDFAAGDLIGTLDMTAKLR